MKANLVPGTRLLIALVCSLTLSACGSAASPYQKERDLQKVLFLDQKRSVIEGYFAQNHIGYAYEPDSRNIQFGIRAIGSSGVFIEIGLGGTIHFDTRDNVESYEVRRHLTGP